jgi:hypothetical protein
MLFLRSLKKHENVQPLRPYLPIADGPLNQELFVFQKIDDAWKIARYCFSTTNPPRT